MTEGTLSTGDTQTTAPVKAASRSRVLLSHLTDGAGALLSIGPALVLWDRVGERHIYGSEGIAALVLLFVVFVFFILLNFPLIAFRGQTWGQFFAGVDFVSLDGRRRPISGVFSASKKGRSLIERVHGFRVYAITPSGQTSPDLSLLRREAELERLSEGQELEELLD